MSSATLPAIIDFPSFGSVEVKPMTVLELAAPLFRSIASLMERSASANRENGALSAGQITSASRKIVLELLERYPNAGNTAGRASRRVRCLPPFTDGTTEM